MNYVYVSVTYKFNLYHERPKIISYFVNHPISLCSIYRNNFFCFNITYFHNQCALSTQIKIP